MQDKLLFQFAVIADTHIRLPDSAEEGGYPSNRLSNDRAKYVVKCLNRIKPDFVIHLGDLVHLIPALGNHESAVKTGSGIFSELETKFFALPGNHDIGDKPNACLPVPVVDEKSHQIFTKYWGPMYQAFTSKNCLFTCIDTPVLNSGFDEGEGAADMVGK